MCYMLGLEKMGRLGKHLGGGLADDLGDAEHDAAGGIFTRNDLVDCLTSNTYFTS